MNVDPLTGEVVDLPALAADYIAVHEAWTESAQETSRLADLKRQAERQITRVLPIDSAIHVRDGVTLTVTPGKPGRRVVDSGVASEHRERLLTVGIGEVVTEFRAPTLAQVNAHRAELVAAGVPMAQLIRNPQPAEPQIVVVNEGALSGR